LKPNRFFSDYINKVNIYKNIKEHLKGELTMKAMKKFLFGFAVVAVCCMSAFGDDSTSQKSDDRRPGGPPPEAFTICEDKNEGDSAEIVTDRGDTLSGTCEKMGDKLVLRPDNLPPMKNRE
jgi:hypothetical protein